MANTEAQVRAAKTPQDALIVIARALDRLELQRAVQPTPDPWGVWSPETDAALLTRTLDDRTGLVERTPEWLEIAQELARSNSGAVEIIECETTTDVVIPTPSAEKQEARRQFERQSLKLAEYLNDDTTDWNGAYAVGGPMWLYLGNRELVMSMPDNVKRALIADVLEDSPQDAQEMSRDILKQPCESGPGSTAMHIGEGHVG